MEYVDNKSNQLIGCSIRGSKHEAVEVPCRDAWTATQLGEECFVIAVGDGVGSANLSHRGSDLATREAVAALEERIQDDVDIRPGTIESVLRESVSAARDAVYDEADKLEESPAELDTTLLIAVADSSGVAGAAVGDGGIVTSQSGSYDLLVPREGSIVELAYPSVTVPLQHKDWEDSYRFGYSETCDGVALFTDGLEDFIYEGQRSINAAFFDDIFRLLRNNSQGNEAVEELADTLNDEPYRSIGDDKTMVVAHPSPDI